MQKVNHQRRHKTTAVTTQKVATERIKKQRQKNQKLATEKNQKVEAEKSKTETEKNQKVEAEKIKKLRQKNKMHLLLRKLKNILKMNIKKTMITR